MMLRGVVGVGVVVVVVVVVVMMMITMMMMMMMMMIESVVPIRSVGCLSVLSTSISC
jgi:hypothetical protein